MKRFFVYPSEYVIVPMSSEQGSKVEGRKKEESKRGKVEFEPEGTMQVHEPSETEVEKERE